ncbi:MAG: glycoside hydrolase family 15 protein [Planctomycetota bacterium]
MLKINNPELIPLIKSSYTAADLNAINAFLAAHGTLDFKTLPNGLFPAADLQQDAQYTGYASIWIRDNIHIAHAHLVAGKPAAAVAAVTSLLTYMKKQESRFITIITKQSDPQSVMLRPHVRFDGFTLSDIDQTWAHAQNDALGYLLWLYFKLADAGHITPSSGDLDFIALFPHYFKALPFWADEDSGHWEETRKVAASSIGVVTAALTMMRAYWSEKSLEGKHGATSYSVTLDLLDDLISNGQSALHTILPSECIQEAPTKKRRNDGALVFLIYPLDVLDEKTADTILSDTKATLQGDYGIRRYIGDSFWAPGYKSKLSEDVRTADFSNDLSARDAMLEKGQEAQWCIFDPTISTIYGRRYQATRSPEDLALQIEYLNRSLGQITNTAGPYPAYRCPELYYIEDGYYVPSDATPLLWTQANLLIALITMEASLKVS